MTRRAGRGFEGDLRVAEEQESHPADAEAPQKVRPEQRVGVSAREREQRLREADLGGAGRGQEQANREVLQLGERCAVLGTLRKGHGTAMVLRADDVAEARRVAARLSELQVGGVLYDLFRERTSLSYGSLSAPVIAALMERGPEALSRPLASLEDLQFVPTGTFGATGGQ